MIIHSVFFWLQSGLSGADKLEFEDGLRALLDIDVVTTGHFGKPAATPPRPVTDHSFDYSLSLQFASVEDHDAYQIHPDHDVFVERFSPWFATVKVFDSTIIP